MKVETHSHTIYSKHWFWGADGINTPRQMVKTAAKKGIGAIAITDHQNVKGSLVAKKYSKQFGVKVITGSELRTNSGDLIALGIKKDVKPRLSVEESIEKIHDLGGIAIAPHPFATYGFSQCIKEKAKVCDAVEVYNSMRFKIYNDKALAFAKKHKKIQIAGSDAHYYLDVGNAGIICSGDPLEAIRKGKVKLFCKHTPYVHMSYLIFIRLMQKMGLIKGEKVEKE